MGLQTILVALLCLSRGAVVSNPIEGNNIHDLLARARQLGATCYEQCPIRMFVCWECSMQISCLKPLSTCWQMVMPTYNMLSSNTLLLVSIYSCNNALLMPLCNNTGSPYMSICHSLSPCPSSSLFICLSLSHRGLW